MQTSNHTNNKQVVQQVFYWTRNPSAAREICAHKGALYDRLLASRAPAREIPGSRAFLGGLRAHGVPLALVATAVPERRVRQTLERLGLEGAFDAVVAAEDAGADGAAEFAYAAAAQALRRPPVRCIVVGDSNRSVEAARELGMKAVALAGAGGVAGPSAGGGVGGGAGGGGPPVGRAWDFAGADLVARTTLAGLGMLNMKRLFSAEDLVEASALGGGRADDYAAAAGPDPRGAAFDRRAAASAAAAAAAAAAVADFSPFAAPRPFDFGGGDDEEDEDDDDDYMGLPPLPASSLPPLYSSSSRASRSRRQQQQEEDEAGAAAAAASPLAAPSTPPAREPALASSSSPMPSPLRSFDPREDDVGAGAWARESARLRPSRRFAASAAPLPPAVAAAQNPATRDPVPEAARPSTRRLGDDPSALAGATADEEMTSPAADAAADAPAAGDAAAAASDEEDAAAYAAALVRLAGGSSRRARASRLPPKPAAAAAASRPSSP